jgi:thiosulfate/3-mercaptopyruvate sulfurtransferase
LRYYGHDRVALLDGGYGAWRDGGHPLTQEVPSPQPGQFTPRWRSEWLRDRTQVLEAIQGGQEILIDSREPERYAGICEPIDPVAGHIPGAINVPWQSATDARGYLLPLEQQRQRWDFLDHQATPVVYCGSGVTACVNILSLAIAGWSPALLYAGSWSDWCSDDRNPIGKST